VRQYSQLLRACRRRKKGQPCRHWSLPTGETLNRMVCHLKFNVQCKTQDTGETAGEVNRPDRYNKPRVSKYLQPFKSGIKSMPKRYSATCHSVTACFAVIPLPQSESIPKSKRLVLGMIQNRVFIGIRNHVGKLLRNLRLGDRQCTNMICARTIFRYLPEKAWGIQQRWRFVTTAARWQTFQSLL
jgi:hypothetical protein